MSNTTSSGAEYEDYADSGKGTVVFGVATFAGVLLSLVSILQILEGIAAIANDKIYARGLSYTYELDVTGWGWLHLILGVVGLATGVGILMGQTWGQIMGVFIAGLSAMANFLFLPYYPFWSMALLAIDIFVIWALCRQIYDDKLAI